MFSAASVPTPCPYCSPPQTPQAIDDTPLSPSPSFLACATESDERKWNAEEIRVHHEGDKIYRFTPGSEISVSIDWASFNKLNIDQRHRLEQGLIFTIATLNTLQLGIRFRYTKTQRGFVELQCRSDRSGAWASTMFPDPHKQQYYIYIYEVTFEPDYYLALPSILAHEFAHLLCMRHCLPRQLKKEPPSLQYPAGDSNIESIMGQFQHPGGLFFHKDDVTWLRKLYEKKAGDKIDGKEIVNVQVPGKCLHDRVIRFKNAGIGYTGLMIPR